LVLLSLHTFFGEPRRATKRRQAMRHESVFWCWPASGGRPSWRGRCIAPRTFSPYFAWLERALGQSNRPRHCWMVGGKG
jgi:hypothetical protein